MPDSLKQLVIKGTDTTPTVNFDCHSGLLEITGRSLPEDSEEFFKPLLEWVNEYANAPQPETTVNINFVYIKSSSFKIMYDMFKVLEKVHANGNPVAINWYYEEDDDEIREMGTDYSAVINMPFTIIELEE